MKAFLIFLTRAVVLLIGLAFLVSGYGFFRLDPPSPTTGWLFLVMGALLAVWVLWPRRTSPRTRPTHKRPFSFEEERRAADNHQVVHITYQDKSGRVSTRDIEVYRPRDDSYVYAYCRSRKEPRTFLVDSILDWTVLPETFLWNPLVEEWFEHEGRKVSDDREDWQDWIATRQRPPVPRGRTLYKLKP